MNKSTHITTLKLNDKISLNIYRRETSKGESFTYRRADNGELLPPVSSIAKLIAEGKFGQTSFVEKKVKERLDEGSGTSRLVETTESYAQASENVAIGNETICLTLEFRPDDSGRFLPKFTGRVVKGDGKRGRAAALPVSEDELF